MSRLNKTQIATEEQIPELAKIATNMAYKRVLASGNSVLISKHGEIRRANPDGSVDFIKKSSPSIRMRKGTIIQIK